MFEMESKNDSVEESLLKYCKSGDYKQVVYIFDKFSENPGFDINCRDRDHNTPLMLAVKQGHGTIVQELLRHMPDISLANKKGQVVMHLATNPILKLIFGCVSTCLPYSDVMFCNACWLSNIEVVQRCLSKERGIVHRGPQNLDGVHCLLLPVINMQLLEDCAMRSKSPYKPAQVVLALLSHFPEIPSSCRNLLHLVAKHICKSAPEVARILSPTFDVVSADEFGFTPLHFAARSGNAVLLEMMLTRSKHSTPEIIDIQSKSGNTPLHLAAMDGRENCVKVLLDLGASRDIENDSGNTPVQLSKTIKINHLFQATDPSRRRMILPEASLTLSRSNTTLPQTPVNKTFNFGKKSAEPLHVTNEVLFATDHSLDKYNDLFVNSKDTFHGPREKSLSFSDSSLLAMTSVKLPMLSSRPTSTPERPKLKFSHNISLECLEEEIAIDLPESVHTSPEEEPVIQNRQKLSNGKIFKQVKSTNKSLVKNRAGGTQKPKKDPPKPTKSKLTPSINKGLTNNKVRKNKEGETLVKESIVASEQPLVENIVEILSDNDVIYESDFSTDNSSVHEDPKKGSSNDIDSEEDNMNNTLTNSNSSDMFTHISWRRGEQLGKGSYGTVWRGMLDDGQYVAVKEILVTEVDELSECSINGSAEIKREIEILQTLRHKNIVKYLGACDSHSCIHIFMEFVSGGSIAFILSKFGGLSERILRKYSRQIVDAMVFMNDNDVVHRDIKGANVMVTPKGNIKLIDFGCAKRLENLSSISQSVQQQSRLHGSVYWMAPEVINGHGHSHKSDVWSLGSTVIEMVTTKPPWSELHAFAAMFAIGSGSKGPPNLKGFKMTDGSLLSDSASEFINTCLIRDSLFRPKAADLLKCSFFK